MSTQDTKGPATFEVIPVPFTDQQKPVNNIRVRTFFFLRHALNNDALKGALDKLIRNHWPKLGARLVTRPNDGFLEYHLPHAFPPDYKLFEWSSTSFDSAIDEASHLPKATAPEDGITLHQPLSAVLKPFMPSSWPLERKHESPGAPMIWVHVSTFTDATVVGVNLPHALSDQLGLRNILKAWLGILKGEVPPPMLGLRDDILSEAVPKSYSELTKAETRRKGKVRVRGKREYFKVLMGFAPDLVMHPSDVNHLLFIPLPLVESLRKRHGEELAKRHGDHVRISNGDIVAGILLKLNQLHQPSGKMVNVTVTINLVRGRIPQLPRDDASYIHNGLIHGSVRVHIGPATPVAEISYQHRQAVVEGTDPNDIQIGLAIAREQVRIGQSMHICEPGESSHSVTNWSVAWKDVDFSPALADHERKDAATPPQMMVLGEGGEVKQPARFVSYVLCKTQEGYWCTTGHTTKSIKSVKELLRTDPSLINF
ncbi:hypothetical protein CI238_05312 [Colletotrichum incanum]|uniref:Uncharacterized protein n=1 Tax=Colletotrichum incanum TaxID=1573173 RepID=A0A162NBJ9_COLIC|nr:hypothetical protein CI238_05312 [Colletotrichum incanum]